MDFYLRDDFEGQILKIRGGGEFPPFFQVYFRELSVVSFTPIVF